MYIMHNSYWAFIAQALLTTSLRDNLMKKSSANKNVSHDGMGKIEEPYSLRTYVLISNLEYMASD